MFLVAVVFLLTLSKFFAGAVSCPYLPLMSDLWRLRFLRHHLGYRSMLAQGSLSPYPGAERMNDLIWNCETEYSLKKIQEQLLDFTTNVTYKNFGVNMADADGEIYCHINAMYGIIDDWIDSATSRPLLVYDGGSDTMFFANLEKWNATEVACTYGAYNGGEVVLLICAYNVKGAVVGEAIYEESQSGKYLCDEGSPCGTNGTCTAKNLCRVPISNPDALLPIYTPSLSCRNLPFMNQFSRYYALNLHNFYRRLVASGWAESKLTQYTARAARMQVLSYECSLEEVANENVKKCEKQSVNKNSVDTGSNVHIIEDVSVTKEAALERAIGEWFKQLQEYGMDPHSSWTEDPTVKDCANIIYENYTAVGCAVNRCTSRGFTVVECRYGPKRLQYGSLVYEVGAPCSKCKAPQKCVLGSLCQ